jgi:hypothetical protein
MSEVDRVEGRPVREVLRGGPLPPAAAFGLAAAVADLVASLHADGAPHARVDADAVLVDDEGLAALAGPPTVPADATAGEVGEDGDLHAVGLILAAALGWPDDEALPASVEALLARASAEDGPAAALARALRRLERDPAAVPELLPPAPRTGPERGGLFAGLVPADARRSTGTAAVVVAGAAVLGLALLLVGSPGSTGSPDATRPGNVAAEAAPAQAPAVEEPAAEPAPTSIRALLSAARDTVRAPLPAPRDVAAAPAAPPPVRVAAPSRPTPTPTRAPVAPTAAPTSTPAAPPTPAPAPTAPVAPTAPPASEPAAPVAPAPEPAPSQQPGSPRPSAPAPAPDTAPATGAGSAPAATPAPGA